MYAYCYCYFFVEIIGKYKVGTENNYIFNNIDYFSLSVHDAPATRRARRRRGRRESGKRARSAIDQNTEQPALLPRLSSPLIQSRLATVAARTLCLNPQLAGSRQRLACDSTCRHSLSLSLPLVRNNPHGKEIGHRTCVLACVRVVGPRADDGARRRRARG